MHLIRVALPRAAYATAFALLTLNGLPAGAQVRCTMPSGVVITQQLGDCPRDAVSATRLDGTPVPVKKVQSQAVAGPNGAERSAQQQAARQVPPSADETGGMSLWNWLIVALLVFGLYAAIKGSGGASGPVRYCATCGHVGKGLTKTRGMLLIEIVLWLCFLVPGLIYSIWRQGSKHKVCASCGASTLVPLDSPVATAARRANADERTSASTQAPPRL